MAPARSRRVAANCPRPRAGRTYYGRKVAPWLHDSADLRQTSAETRMATYKNKNMHSFTIAASL